MTSLFFTIINDWELASIGVTLLISAYLLIDLIAAVLWPPPPRRYPKQARFPMVSVVIPVYNEPLEIVRASIETWKAVRYPKFEIIVADDSTEPLELNDPSVRVLRRASREGFKGGALRNAVDHLDPASEWMVVFDADFLVDPDVLVRFTEHYAPDVGGVQGFQAMGANQHPTYLSRFSESFHYVANTLLAGRYQLKGFVGVQGTVQSYRVAAIREIGGLAPYSTANEDLDTTFRLRKAGWKIVYDPRIVGRGIAPERYKVFFIQATRWTSSTVREYRRHYLSYLRSRNVPAREKLDAFFFLMTWTNSLVVTPTLLFLPWAIWNLHLIPLWLSLLITVLPVTLFAIPTLLGTPARVGLIGWVGYYVLLLPGYIVMFRASLLGLFTDPGFARTSKVSAAATPGELTFGSARRRAAKREPTLPMGSGSTAHRATCTQCGRTLSHREVLFFAVGGLDLDGLTCGHCLRREEWLRGRVPAPG